MSTKKSSKLIMLLFAFVVTISTFSPVSHAADSSKTLPVITDYKGSTFIRSDGSAWMLSGGQLIPTQVAGITNAVKVLENGFVQTADGKTYALQMENNIIKPFLLKTDSNVVKVNYESIIDQDGKLYKSYLYFGEQMRIEVEKFNAYSIPFSIQNYLTSYYSFERESLTVNLFLTTDGKIWVRDNVSREFQQLGNNDTTFVEIYDQAALDANGTVWVIDINADNGVTYTLKPVSSNKKIKQLSYGYGDMLAINEDQEALFYTSAGWEAFRTVDNKKVLQIAGGNSNYYYLTADHMLYYKSMNKSTLITTNIASFDLHRNSMQFFYQKLDGSLGTWPSSTVQIRDEQVRWDPTNATAFNLQVPIPVYVNNKVIAMPKGAWLLNNTTYLPLRSIFTELGATVSWDNASKIASLSTNVNGQATNIKIDYSKQQLYINNKLIPIEQELFIADGSAFLPLRLVSEGLGAKVDWNQNTKDIHITSEQ